MIGGMAKSAKNFDAASALNADMPFEEALKKLEGIVEAMESGDLPLETMLARYEEGALLARACQAKLAEAELKIQTLERNMNGETVLKPFLPEEDDREP
jgi:exodeoxyribonuclease VII small subunit